MVCVTLAARLLSHPDSTRGQRTKFELMLSSTFLTEAVGRRELYRTNGGVIVWAFEHFHPTETRTAEENVFYLNNLNVFIVNEAALERSHDARRAASS